jgi:hypothetical protein
MIVMLTPRGEFLAVASGTPSIFPGSRSPCTGFPSRLTSAAAQWVNAGECFDVFRKILTLRYTYIPRAAFRTRQLHLGLVDYIEI